MKTKSYSLLLCLAVLYSFPAPAQEEFFAPPKRTMQAVRTDTPPVIDGKFDEPQWNDAEVMTDFVNTRLEILSEDQSKVRMLYDDTYLYFAVEVMEKKKTSSQTSSSTIEFNSDSKTTFRSAWTLSTTANRPTSSCSALSALAGTRGQASSGSILHGTPNGMSKPSLLKTAGSPRFAFQSG